MTGFIIAATLLSLAKGGVELSVEGDSVQIDPARNVVLELSIVCDRGVSAAPPDLRDRARGFSLAENYESPLETLKDGRTRQVVTWKLAPEPCAEEYKIAPFAVGDIVAGPIKFEPPAAREPVTGEMEVNPKKDLPPLSWRLAGIVLAILAAAALVVTGVVLLVRFAARKVKEHRMSPIERAWVELDRLIKKGLPGKGKYKDFYVELTMVVRRYVQRRYGVKAPHMTTEEFLKRLGELGIGERASSGALADFLESADMVKFAGVEATPEMAGEATESARTYLRNDSAAPAPSAEGGAQ